jgi:hypothetical protein
VDGEKKPRGAGLFYADSAKAQKDRRHATIARLTFVPVRYSNEKTNSQKKLSGRHQTFILQ